MTDQTKLLATMDRAFDSLEAAHESIANLCEVVSRTTRRLDQTERQAGNADAGVDELAECVKRLAERVRRAEELAGWNVDNGGELLDRVEGLTRDVTRLDERLISTQNQHDKLSSFVEGRDANVIRTEAAVEKAVERIDGHDWRVDRAEKQAGDALREGTRGFIIAGQARGSVRELTSRVEKLEHFETELKMNNAATDNVLEDVGERLDTLDRLVHELRHDDDGRCPATDELFGCDEGEGEE